MTDTVPSSHTTLADEKAVHEHRLSGTSFRSSTDRGLSSSGEKSAPIDPDVEHGIPIVDTTEDADTKAARQETSSHDPNVIDWDSPEDTARAVNWSSKKKWSNIAVVSTVTFLTPLASSMVAPAIPLIMKDFKSSNETIAAFIVSIYILGYALGPLILAPMSELYGRLPVYHICNSLFVVWTIACALAPNMGALLAFRLFAGIAGSCPITIGAGSIADVFIPQERGGAMAIFAMGPLLGPVIGPVAGGYLSEAAGWRWIFWLITIAVCCPCSQSSNSTNFK